MVFSRTLLVLLIAIVVVSFINYLLLSRLFAFYRQRIIRYSYVGISLISFLVLAYAWTRRPHFVVHEYLEIVVYSMIVWFLGQFLLLAMQPLIYVVHRLLSSRKAPDHERGDLTRREFLQRSLALAPLISIGSGAQGVFAAQNGLVANQFSLSMPALPPSLDGYKIVQISDTHVGPYFDLEKLDRVIDLTARQKPDLVVVTGDFVDRIDLLRPAVERLDELSGQIRHGIYFCWGNHDYYRDITVVRAAVKKSRLVALENRSELIVGGQRPFYLLGVDYPWNRMPYGIEISPDKRKQFFADANRDVPDDAFKVLISHHPDSHFEGFKAKIPLTLTGHTHGGQIVVGGKSLYSPFEYMRGLYRENGVYGYVSSGAGHWFPFRVGCPPEISVFTLAR